MTSMWFEELQIVMEFANFSVAHMSTLFSLFHPDQPESRSPTPTTAMSSDAGRRKIHSLSTRYQGTIRKSINNETCSN